MEKSTNGTCQSLLVRIFHEEPIAWDHLVDLYSPLVASWCRSKGLKNQDVADVLQDVFLTVSRSFCQFFDRNEIQQKKIRKEGVFRAWLWTITKSRIVDWARKQKPDQAVGGSSAAAKVQSIEDLQDDEPTTELDRQSLVGRAMAQIEPDFTKNSWLAFWAVVVEGKSTQVVADQMGMSQASVRQVKSRILRRLRQQLGDIL